MEVGVFEARNRFSELIDAAERGEEVIVLKRGRPVVRMVPAEPAVDIVARRLKALDDLASLRRRTVQEVGRPFTHAELIEALDAGKR
ncbi:type II toxin-antitoxin system prevent-host-death family antitoxin [Pseudomonas sp. ODNR1LW]|nr:type II toxin-antitoxin system prevent-host-death family antitoxin [Pseudomonas sp. ODNR1LW]